MHSLQINLLKKGIWKLVPGIFMATKNQIVILM